MSTSATHREQHRRDAARVARIAPTPAQLAWIGLLPCTLVTVVAVLLLGPVVGHTLLEPRGEALWPQGAVFIFGEPEPVKHGRFLVALLGPVLLAATVLMGSGRPLPLRAGTLRATAIASQALLAVVAVAATLAQRRVAYDSLPAAWRIFTPLTWAVAVALAAALCVPQVTRWLARLRSDGRGTRIACAAVAAAATVLWLLPAITTERSIAGSPFLDLPPWAMGDTYAILDGRTPLVDFVPLYGHLWAYVAALPMAVLGAKITVFSVVMASGSALALLSVYAILRRIVGDPLPALALYVPFLATSLFVVAVEGGRWIVTNSEIYSVWPMRYGGPLLLAWLTVRHLDGAAPRRLWLLFLVAGLVAINNLEFGLGALAGTVVAIACSPAAWSREGLRRLAAGIVGGLLAAVALVALLTLVRAGELPRFGMLLEFPHVFGVLGLAALPVGVAGFQIAIYVTLAGAAVVAAVRVAGRAPDVVLTGMLAWSAVFGLVAGSYFMGRSDPLKLAALFPAWALALMLLVVVTMRSLAASDRHRPSLGDLLVLLGFGLAVCSIAQLPSPVRQLERLRPVADGPIYEQVEAHRLVDRSTRPGEHVAILIPMGHRIAYDLQLVNVSPYGFIDEIATREQMRTLLDAVREEHAHKLFVLTSHLAPEHGRTLTDAGFNRRGELAQYSYWADGSVAR